MSVQIDTPRLELSNTEIICIADESLEFRARVSADDAIVNLWCKDEQRRPVGAVFVLAHEVFEQIEHFDQVVWFNRTATHDELWAYTDTFTSLASTLTGLPTDTHAGYIDDFSHQCACVFSVPRSRSFDESLIDLVSSYFSTAAGAPCAMEHLIATGYIGPEQFELLYHRMLLDDARRRREHEEWSRQARENETEIIHVARELGLNPEPTGIGPVQWYARCPGSRGHSVMITTSNDEFGCGYCRVKGGVAELRAFVAEGRPLASSPPPQNQATN